MTKILVLGAAGRIARLATRQFLEEGDAELTLFLRDAGRLPDVPDDGVRVIEGDATDTAALAAAARGQDVVYANLAGDDIVAQARSVVAAMDGAGVRRLIWISAMGIYDEVPGAFGEWNHKMLDGGYLEAYGEAAQVIEASDLAYTIVRPAWLTDHDEVDYELTGRDEPFKGTEVSRKSVADLVVTLAREPGRGVGESLGVDKPGTDGDKPSWY
jgi:uncharacterized protein YbjT (DUF2867 family)